MSANSVYWRRLNNALHRDLGYLACTLTILYALSGIAVNHIEDWNASYSTRLESFTLTPPAGADPEALQRALVAKLGIDPASVRGWHRPDPDRFVLFLPDGGEAAVNTATGAGIWKRLSPRPLLFESNVLHLNHLKGVWTYVADAYAVVLLILAVTGLFVLKGENGLWGRGKWWVLAGTLLPLAFVLYYRLTRA